METFITDILFFKQFFMAQLQQAENTRHRPGVRRAKRLNTRIDMTPMVDLGFLLICFFVITTTMSQPRAADLFVPKDGPPIDIANSKTLTVLLDKDNGIYYYHGSWENALAANGILSSGYLYSDGIGNIIREKQKRLEVLNLDKEKGKGLILVIKASEKSSYKNLVDMLDEVLINDVKHYSVVDLTEAEKNYISEKDK